MACDTLRILQTILQLRWWQPSKLFFLGGELGWRHHPRLIWTKRGKGRRVKGTGKEYCFDLRKNRPRRSSTWLTFRFIARYHKGFLASIHGSANGARHKSLLNGRWKHTFAFYTQKLRDVIQKPLPPVSGTSKHSRMQLTLCRNVNEVVHIG